MSNRKAKRILRFDGSLTVSRAASVRSALLGALDAGPSISIDCGGADEIDVSFIQLLVSARRSAAARGKTLSLVSPANGALLQALERGGFLTVAANGSPPDRDFWVGETAGA